MAKQAAVAPSPILTALLGRPAATSSLSDAVVDVASEVNHGITDVLSRSFSGLDITWDAGRQIGRLDAAHRANRKLMAACKRLGVSEAEMAAFLTPVQPDEDV